VPSAFDEAVHASGDPTRGESARDGDVPVGPVLVGADRTFFARNEKSGDRIDAKT
jgi:hypothetical protein